ncbi:MAG: hypothetical protein AAGF12_08615 [Myxococcota bacterium]
MLPYRHGATPVPQRVGLVAWAPAVTSRAEIDCGRATQLAVRPPDEEGLMPSMVHEAIVDVFQQCPELAAELLERVAGAPVAHGLAARVVESGVTDAVPLSHKADCVVMLYDQDRAQLALIVEVQLSKDPAKKYSWPRYLTGVAATFGVMANVLVVTTHVRVQRWAAEPIQVGLGNNVITPFVVGPADLPAVDRELASARPELAVLSAIAHPSDIKKFETALSAVARLDEDRAKDYTLYLFATAAPAVRRALERDMPQDIHIDGIGSLREYLGKWRDSGREEGQAHAIVAVLESRGISVDEATRARILSCGDHAQLDEWLAAAARAERLEDVLGDR